MTRLIGQSTLSVVTKVFAETYLVQSDKKRQLILFSLLRLLREILTLSYCVMRQAKFRRTESRQTKILHMRRKSPSLRLLFSTQGQDTWLLLAWTRALIMTTAQRAMTFSKPSITHTLHICPSILLSTFFSLRFSLLRLSFIREAFRSTFSLSVWWTFLALLTRRVLGGCYPAGFTPSVISTWNAPNVVLLKRATFHHLIIRFLKSLELIFKSWRSLIKGWST